MNQLLDATGRAIDPETIQAVRQTTDDRNPVTTRVPYNPRTPAGVVMTPDRALTISAVWRAIQFLAQTVALMPWRVKRETDAGSEIQRFHPVDRLLKCRVSSEWSSFQFRETLMNWALRHGNGYAEIERGIDDRPVAIHPIHPTRVTVMRDLNEPFGLFYRIVSDHYGYVDLDPEDVFHIRGFGEGPVGVNVLAYAAQSLGWAKAVQMFGASFFGGGANPAGIVQFKKALGPEALGVLRSEFAKIYSGPNTRERTIFLDNEATYQPLSIEPDKGQFIETNRFLIEEVCRWIGVPPHKVYELSRGTFSNIEHQSIEVVADSIMPWAKRFEDEANYKLFGQNRPNLFTDIDLKPLLRADTTTRLAYYTGLRNIGVLNGNEIRGEEGYNGIGPDGDLYTMQSGFTSLDKIGEEPEPAPAPPPAEPEPEEDPPAEDPPADPEPEPTENTKRMKIKAATWSAKQ